MGKILTLGLYGEIKPIFGGNTSAIASEVVESFEGVAKELMIRRYAASMKAGMFYILDHAKYPGKIVEHVMGLAGDSISGLYEVHPIFASPGTLLTAREDLIEMIESSENAAPGVLKMMDEGRGRPVFLQEMTTSQLIDLVQRALLRRGHGPTIAL